MNCLHFNLTNFFFEQKIYLQNLKLQRHKKVDGKNCPSHPCPPVTNFFSPEVFHDYSRNYMRVCIHSTFFSPVFLGRAAYSYVHCSTPRFVFRLTPRLGIPSVSAHKAAPPSFLPLYSIPLYGCAKICLTTPLVRGFSLVPHLLLL